MFGMGMGELLLIFVIGLLVFGPDKLPQVARNIGKTMRDLKRTTNEIKYSIDKEINLSDIKQTLDLPTEVKRSMRDIVMPQAEVERRRRAKVRQLKERSHADSAPALVNVASPSVSHDEKTEEVSSQPGDAGPSKFRQMEKLHDG